MNKKGDTVAMIMVNKNKKDIPECWRHEATLTNKCTGDTVAMMMAKHYTDIPECWRHE